MANVILIIDPSEAYLRTKLKEIYTEWGFTTSDVKHMTEWSPVPSGLTLFGERIMTHLDLSNGNDMKKFVGLLSDKATKKIFDGDWIGNGVIITAKKAQGAKKIENLVTKAGGQVLKSAKSNVRKKELLSELKVKNEIKTTISEYVGEDYELLLSFYNEMIKLDPKEQKKMTLDDAFALFPPKPGSVPPWDYLNALFNGSTTESIATFERTLINTHYLVPLTFLTRKTALLYRVVLSLQDSGINTGKQISEAIGVPNNFELTNTLKVAKRINPKSAELIAQFATELESKLKGGSVIAPEILFKETIVKIGLLLGNQQ